MPDRRQFVGALAAGAGALAAGHWLAPWGWAAEPVTPGEAVPAADQPAYSGPNVVLVRFGGGVRRQETILPRGTFCPYFLNELVPRGVFCPAMEISEQTGEGRAIDTSHGQGTLNLLTGRYDRYRSVSQQVLGERFEPAVPTLFEYLRAQFAVPAEQAIYVNGENRPQEEFYSFSNHHAYGVAYRCHGLSLYRFRHWLLRRLLAEGDADPARLRAYQRELASLTRRDERGELTDGVPPAIQRFWEAWYRDYGASGLRHPRGDALLTELAVRALHQLQPRLLLINYNDPDYVHWGNATHYTRAITLIDEGLRRLVELCDTLPFYRDRTVFAIVPDCGRDDNALTSLPFQHHFNGASSRRIFALFMGAGVGRGRVIERVTEQISVPTTLGRLMGLKLAHADGPVLDEVFA